MDITLKMQMEQIVGDYCDEHCHAGQDDECNGCDCEQCAIDALYEAGYRLSNYRCSRTEFLEKIKLERDLYQQAVPFAKGPLVLKACERVAGYYNLYQYFENNDDVPEETYSFLLRKTRERVLESLYNYYLQHEDEYNITHYALVKKMLFAYLGMGEYMYGGED